MKRILTGFATALAIFVGCGLAGGMFEKVELCSKIYGNLCRFAGV